MPNTHSPNKSNQSIFNKSIESDKVEIQPVLVALKCVWYVERCSKNVIGAWRMKHGHELFDTQQFLHTYHDRSDRYVDFQYKVDQLRQCCGMNIVVYDPRLMMSFYLNMLISQRTPANPPPWRTRSIVITVWWSIFPRIWEDCAQ